MDIETEVAHRGHHEVVDTLIVQPRRSDGFGVERRFAVNHPQIAPYERHGKPQLIAEPLARESVTQRQLLQADIRRRIEIILRQTRLRADRLIPFLGIDHLTAVDQNTARIARRGRSLRDAVQVEVGLRRRIADTAQTGRKQHAEVNTLIAEVIAPCEVVVRENRSEIDVLAFVGHQQVAVLVHLDITVVVEAKVGRRVKVAQRTAFLEDVLRLTQPLDVQLGKIQRFARNRVHGIGCQFDDLVLVP